MSRRGQAWSIHRDRQGRTTTRLSRRDLRPLSQRRLSAKHGKELDLNRTQEVAGSSPASSTTRKACKRRPFSLFRRNEDVRKSYRGQVLVNLK